MAKWIAVILLLAASSSFAAVNPDTPDTHNRPEPATDAKPRKVRCVMPRTFILALRLPDGRKIAVKTVVVWTEC